MPNQLFKKQYEDIYSVDHVKEHVLHLDRMSSTIMGLDEYTDFFKDFLRSFYFDLYNNYVKLAWLRRIFLYNGKKITANGNSRYTQTAFVKYLHRIVGMNIQIITRGSHFSAVTSYFDEFYPGFDEGNPFENPEYYKFPFENLSLEFLVVAARLEDRMLLLEEANRQKMSYANFLDLIINQVSCVNEGSKNKKYRIGDSQYRGSSFYVSRAQKNKPKKK